MMPGNVKEFTKQLNAFGKKVQDKDLVKVQKKVSIDLLKLILEKTPIRTGRATASWNISVNNIDPSVAPESIRDTKGNAKGMATSKITRLVNLRPFSTVFISNNLPYIVALEGGSSDQAPAGMVGLSIAEMTTFLKLS